MWHALCDRISQQSGKAIDYISSRPVSGGCIHNAQILETAQGNYFVKINSLERLPLFQAEAEGLIAIQNTRAIRCPEVIMLSELDNRAVLVLEYIVMKPAQPGSMEKLGVQLAELHRNTGPSFGWPNDNFIGLTPQPNEENQDWPSFFKKSRLEYQILLAERRGLKVAGKSDLMETLEQFFKGHTPIPSLLHGDLWGGNIGFDLSGDPVIFDPACYYGDREAELAFTEMFGGFSADFYRAYQSSFPMSDGYALRKRLYNLYHELNHFNLFGGGYGRQAAQTVQFLLRAK